MMGQCLPETQLLLVVLCLVLNSVTSQQVNGSVVLDQTCARQVAKSLTNQTGFLTEAGAEGVLDGFAQLCINVPATCAFPGNSTDNGSKDFSASTPSKRTGTILLSTLVPTGALLLAICSWVIWCKWHTPSRSRRRTLWGRLKAPAASEESTLVVSDIESSTHLWEVLDESVMDSAVTQHHACLRACIAACAGYEASVEGDSFITAFHDATDAAQYCICVQVALLGVKWPDALLAVPNCRPIYFSDIPPPGYTKQAIQSTSLLLGAPAAHEDASLLGTAPDMTIKAGGDQRDASSQASKSSGGLQDRSQHGHLGALHPGAPPRVSRQGQHSGDGTGSEGARLAAMVASEASSRDSIADAAAGSGSGSRLQSAEVPRMLSSAGSVQHGQGPFNMGAWRLSRSGGQKSPLAKGSSSPSSSAPDNTVRRSADAVRYNATGSEGFGDGGRGVAKGEGADAPLLLQHPSDNTTPRTTPEGSDRSDASTLKSGGALVSSFSNKKTGPRKMPSQLQWADLAQQPAAPARLHRSMSPNDLVQSTPTSTEDAARISPPTRASQPTSAPGVMQPLQEVVSEAVSLRSGITAMLPPIPDSGREGTADVSREHTVPGLGGQDHAGQGMWYGSYAAGHSAGGYHAGVAPEAPVSIDDALAFSTANAMSGECLVNASDILVTLAANAQSAMDTAPSNEPLHPISSPTLYLNNSASPLGPLTLPDVEAISTQLPVMSVVNAPEDVGTPASSTTIGQDSSSEFLAPFGTMRTDLPAGKGVVARPTVSRQSSRLAGASFPTLTVATVPMGGAVDESARNSSPMVSPTGSPSMFPPSHNEGLEVPSGAAALSRASSNEASAGSAPFLRNVAFRVKSFSRTLASGLFRGAGSSLDASGQHMQGSTQGRHTGSTSHTQQQNSSRTSISNQTAATRKAPLGPESGAVEDSQEATTTTVGQMLQSRYYEVSAADAGARLMFRGLRVRMGCHSGLTQQDCQYNKAASRMQYTGGPACSVAKAVCDSACGGMILLSDNCHDLLYMDQLQQTAMVLHMGDHQLKSDISVMALHQVVPRQLMPRLPLLAPVRSHCTCGLGVLDAPAGLITVAFMHVVGEGSLMSWNSDVALESLSLFQHRAGALLHKHGGYLVEGVNGFMLASFPRAISATRWALQCVTDLKRADWPDELLAHEMGEELVTRTLDATGRLTENIMLRGLRIKAGLDCGRLRGEVSCVTGRMAYRGRYMNRAARIASAAGTGQVLVSADVYNACKSSAACHLYAASSLGMHRFKGVVEPVEVFDMRPQSSVMLTKRTSISLSQAAHQDYSLHEELHGLHSMFSITAQSRRASRPSNLGPFGNPAFAPSRPTSGASYLSRGPSRTMSFRNSVTNSVRRSLLMLGVGVSTGGIDRSRTHTSHTRTSRSSMASSRNIVLGETPQASNSTVLQTGGSSNTHFLNVTQYRPMVIRRASTTVLGGSPPALSTRMSMDMPTTEHRMDGSGYAGHTHALPHGGGGSSNDEIQAGMFPDGQVHGGQTLLLAPAHVIGSHNKTGNGAQMPVVKEDSDSGPLTSIVAMRAPPQGSLDRRTMSDTGGLCTHLNNVAMTGQLPPGILNHMPGTTPAAMMSYNRAAGGAAALPTSVMVGSLPPVEQSRVSITAGQHPPSPPRSQQGGGGSSLMHAMHQYDAGMHDAHVMQQQLDHSIMSGAQLGDMPALGPRSSMNAGSGMINMSYASNNTGSSGLNPRGSMAAYCGPMAVLPEVPDGTASSVPSSGRRVSHVTWGEDALASSSDMGRGSALAAGPQAWDRHSALPTAATGTKLRARSSGKRASAPHGLDKPHAISRHSSGNLFVVSGASSDEDEGDRQEEDGVPDANLHGAAAEGQRAVAPHSSSSGSSSFAMKAKHVLREASLRSMTTLLQRMAGGGSGGQDGSSRQERSHKAKQWHPNLLAGEAPGNTAAAGLAGMEQEAGVDARPPGAMRGASATGPPPPASALRTRFSSPHAAPAPAVVQQAYLSHPTPQMPRLPASLVSTASHGTPGDSSQQLVAQLYQQPSQPATATPQDIEMGPATGLQG